MINKKSIKVIVNCCKNDSVDFKCGGPLFLGFDFYVKDKKTANFIPKLLEKYNCPVSSITESESGIKPQWNKLMIEKEIKKYAINEGWYKK